MIDITNLTSYKKCVNRINNNWSNFLQKREKRLLEFHQYGKTSEKISESIMDILFSEVLDWEISLLRYQIGNADIILTNQGIKYLVIETKRPGSLQWSERAIEKALNQALRYAIEQHIKTLAISDGSILYAANVIDNNLQDRVYIDLNKSSPQLDLWWLSVHGIYREYTLDSKPLQNRVITVDYDISDKINNNQKLHPKYKRPYNCFAYVGDINKTSTWKLPYLLINKRVDTKRLPKAIQTILTNYRGKKVSSSNIPEREMPNILKKLGSAASSIGLMPNQNIKTSEIYYQLQNALDQIK